MSKCNKLNCPMQYNKVADDCDIKDCPYRTTDKIEDWETASKFLAMIFETFEKQRKENTEKSNEIVAFPEKPKKEQIEEMAMLISGNEIQHCGHRDIAERLYNAGYRKQKEGEWIGEADGYADGELVYDVWHCSECNHCIDDGTDDADLLPNFCPNCGAKMKGE